MPVFKINSKRKENKKREKESKKLNKLWLHSLIQSSKIKKNKSDLKIKKCLSILKINSKNKNKTNSVELKSKKNKRNKWENILQGKLKRKKLKRCKKKRLIKNKPKFGKKILKTSLKMRKIRLTIWRTSTNNMRAFWKNKWMIRKRRKTERKWTLWNFFIIRL